MLIQELPPVQTQQKTAKTLGALTVEQIYGRTLELQPNGASYKGLCPFPSEKSASFVVYRDKHFHCYGCGAHGSAFDFVMMTKHLDFPAALAHLEGQVGNCLSWEASAARGREITGATRPRLLWRRSPRTKSSLRNF